MNKQISCGFVIRSKGKYLLGRASCKRDPAWTFFKGKIEEGESDLDAAIRELEEESSIDLKKFPQLLSKLSGKPDAKYLIKNRKKEVRLFFLDDSDGLLYDVSLKCNTFWGDNIPEISEYKWCDLKEAEKMLFNSQKCIIPKIENFFEV